MTIFATQDAYATLFDPTTNSSNAVKSAYQAAAAFSVLRKAQQFQNTCNINHLAQKKWEQNRRSMPNQRKCNDTHIRLGQTQSITNAQASIQSVKHVHITCELCKHGMLSASWGFICLRNCADCRSHRHFGMNMTQSIHQRNGACSQEPRSTEETKGTLPDTCGTTHGTSIALSCLCQQGLSEPIVPHAQSTMYSASASISPGQLTHRYR